MFTNSLLYSQITQISCFDTANLAPSGCTKYFTINTPKQIIQTYNYEGGNQLANQRETFCFRYLFFLLLNLFLSYLLDELIKIISFIIGRRKISAGKI